MTHRAATSGRAFSTTSIKNWQYTYGQALQIAGPALKKSVKRTPVNNGNKGTAIQPLPVALSFIQPPQFPHLDLQNASPRKWAELVQAIPDPTEQAKMKNEDAVITEAICLQRGRGPLHLASLQALDKLATTARNEDGEHGLTLLNSKGVTLEMRTLIKQGVKYQRQTGTPIVIFYDYDYLMIMEPPPDLEEQSQQLMCVTLCQEAEKSTEGNLVMCKYNHVAVLIRYIIKAVQKLEGVTPHWTASHTSSLMNDEGSNTNFTPANVRRRGWLNAKHTERGFKVQGKGCSKS